MTAQAEIAAALPEYEIGGELGRGGFGVVFTGRHRHLEREVAIKELPAALAGDPKVRYRFAAEARVLAALSHPHIVPIYDYVEREGLCLLVMEKLPGGTVWSHFKERGFTLETTCAVVMAMCAGLHYAHQRGVLHRDVKPENVLFSADHVLKITDFGIAKVLGGDETLATRGGEILGTPAYMAPEQAEGRELGAPADIYATGALLYELMSGRLPFSEEGGALAIVYRHVYEDPIPLPEVAPEVPPPLVDVTMRTLARSPEDRYPSAEAFGVALGEAATSLWGPGWLDRAELTIVDPGPISEAAKRPSGPGFTPAVTPPAPDAAVPRARRPFAVGSRSSRGDRPPPAGSAQPAPSAPAAPSTRVRPQVSDHVGGAVAAQVAEADLVPVREVIELPPPPTVQTLAALVLTLVMLTVAFVGLGGANRTTAIEEGVAQVAGKDPAGGGAVELDLSKPIEIRLGQLPPEARAAQEVQLGLSFAGIPLPASTAERLEPGDSGLHAAVSASGGRYLVAGEVTAELRLLADDEVVLRHEFPVRSEQPDFLTVPGVLVVALILFLLAYAESLLRPLRRGRRRVVGVVGMVLLGTGLGVMAVLLGSLLGGSEPRRATAAVCMFLGGAAAAAASAAAIRVGQRRRIKPNIRDDEPTTVGS